ncbi:hypothetical protein BBJ28_00011379 [Nothophytophthora sp. Chile5]|nr:hypothetical protein BBJ28_00011379 [Nothophytophthora sp. Chile5]
MGNFLATPIIEKDTEKGEGNGVTYAIASMQGWRTGMEDAHVAELDPEGLPQGSSVFAVFDGHGGHLAAELASRKLTSGFATVMKSGVFPDGKLDNADPKKIGEAMREAFMALDKDLYSTFEKENGSDQSGCTAISAFLTRTHIIVANAGDSRSVLAKDGRTVEMSFDHKPINVRPAASSLLTEERKRIQNAGGLVRSNRVNGDLAVSRALGDFSYKARVDLPPEKQQVRGILFHLIAEPDIEIQKIDGTEEFLVIACDGIWDVMTNDDLCGYVRQLMNNGESNLVLIAEEILDHCLRAGSRDNMSVVIVKFPAAKIGEGGGVAKIREERKRLDDADAEANGEEGEDPYGGDLAGVLAAKST